MTRWALLPLALILGCSGVDEGEAGVVAIEVTTPSPPVLEVGEALQLSARPLDKNGDSVGATVTWRAADNTLSVDATTGLVTGLAPGPGRVQATVGSLASPLITFSVIAPADTLIIAGDSVLTVPADQPASTPLLVRLESFSPAGPVASRPVIYALTSPDPNAGPPGVALAGGQVVDTLTTGADGMVSSVTLNRVAGAVPPDSAIVEVRAERTRGAVVPGSGQRFIIRFQ